MTTIKFAHLADLHLGAYREKTLTQLNLKTFQKAVEKIIEEKAEFAIFAGDIFNNAMPPIELVMQVIEELMKLKKENIPIYYIGGSHDYSITGKSFLELLEKTHIITNIAKYRLIDKNKVELIPTTDKKTQANLYGITGKKNELEKTIYDKITTPNLDKKNLNIFVFHTTLNDFKPSSLKNLKAKNEIKNLPKEFNYYAGGHIHTPMQKEFENFTISYSGALFPNNFKEIKEETPTFNICEYNPQTKKTKIKQIKLNTYEKEHIQVNVDKLNPLQAKNKILEEIDRYEIENKIILLEIEGTIEGKITDMELNTILKILYEKKAKIILKNTYKLKTKYLEELSNHAQESQDTKEIEKEIINQKLKEQKEKINIIINLLTLELEKQEGDKVAQYEEKIIKSFDKIIKT